MLNLRISENGAEVQQVSNGVSHWRRVDIQALIRVFNEAVLEIKEEEVFASPMLPIGTLGYIENKDLNAYSVIMYREPRIAGIIFESRTYEVGYPGTIYVFTVTNEILTRVSIYAVKDHVLQPETDLYRYPYFNVYQDGHMCLGNNQIKIQKPWLLHKMPDIITAMPTNNGLATSNRSGLKGDSLLKAIEGKPFPNEWLTPTTLKLKNLF